MKEILIPRLSREVLVFPDPREAMDGGLLAFGGDLSPSRLLLAYRSGIFPWYSQGDPILWWSPDPRLVLFPEKLKISKSLRKILKSGRFEIRMDTAFGEVIYACGMMPREGQDGTWILPEMIEAYEELHHLGYAHSVETYMEGELVGGLYGVSLGGVFFGESMFSREPDASKSALAALVTFCLEQGIGLIDCQVTTDHLMRMGAEEIERNRFLDLLKLSLEKETLMGAWRT